ncbi:DUF2268 domain-containing protein [Aquibacillus sp. 3ASR75-11]|uniref:DUF2268 domain-containing protein n=1 Tax=Terrihalobacillus insolitus TaxID=2950438 RepID=A0A9X4AN89_9BACI|nr:DUF2268 domain-containing putative Zn-dependent protease [Terrihalobacillus insolitus]MDC3413278.1 DUF2268 domain-containing protein [Terrihalobacillus insolitus]MDC3426262.1 DUF2268 domain-containing protein [Terrihalobacillus insolitus]
MAVVSTDAWLRDYVQNKGINKSENMELQRQKLCSHLKPYFDHAFLDEIQNHLHEFGFFLPHPSDAERINRMKENNVWENTQRVFKELKEEWKGPDIPVFIFPSNIQNEMLRNDFNGKSGLGYRDKVFIFISDHTPKEEIRALVTHEYNHVCRLEYLNLPEDEINLLDSIVLEGIAEIAVRDYLGEGYVSKWAKLYRFKDALNWWMKWIRMNSNIKKTDDKHLHLLYGGGNIPKWMGYHTGYHLVLSYVRNNSTDLKTLLRLPSESIVQGSDFPF